MVASVLLVIPFKYLLTSPQNLVYWKRIKKELNFFRYKINFEDISIK